MKAKPKRKFWFNEKQNQRGNFDEKQDIFLDLPKNCLAVTKQGSGGRNYSGEIRHLGWKSKITITRKGQMVIKSLHMWYTVKERNHLCSNKLSASNHEEILDKSKLSNVILKIGKRDVFFNNVHVLRQTLEIFQN